MHPIGGWSLTGKMEIPGQTSLGKKLEDLRRKLEPRAQTQLGVKEGFGFSWSGHHRGLRDPGDAPTSVVVIVAFSSHGS